MVSVQEAHRLIRQSIAPLGHDPVALASAGGRVLAETILAPFAQPRFTNAAMDGFALRGEALAGMGEGRPVSFRVTMRIAAGSQPVGSIEEDCAAEIMTGAPMPEGADTVVPFEWTSGFGAQRVEVYRAFPEGANVRYRGEEVGEGAVLLQRGTILRPSELAVLAAFGINSFRVARVPRVSLVTLGDELFAPGEMLPACGIYDSNSPMLVAACRAIGIEPSGVRRGADDPAAVRRLLEASLAESDVLITAGGISTGEYDFVQRELDALGVETRFWKVAQKPGKPFYFGMAPGGKAVFALPGNPVSSMVCFCEYCSEALALMQGREPAGKLQAVLEAAFPADRKRHRFLLGRLRVEDGRLFCRVSTKVESHMITSAAEANCIVEAPASATPLAAGSLASCRLLPWAGHFC